MHRLIRYYLNGNWRVNLYGDVNFAGAKWEYKRQALRSEILQSEGPLTEDVIIEVTNQFDLAEILITATTIYLTGFDSQRESRDFIFLRDAGAQQRAALRNYRAAAYVQLAGKEIGMLKIVRRR